MRLVLTTTAALVALAGTASAETYTATGVRIENARCVRYWGTTRGLGELADGGPTKNTKLDPMGTVVLPTRAVIGVLACKSEW